MNAVLLKVIENYMRSFNLSHVTFHRDVSHTQRGAYINLTESDPVGGAVTAPPAGSGYGFKKERINLDND